MATPRYRLAEKTFIKAPHTQEAWMRSAGDEIEWTGRPGRTWIGLNEEAIAALALIEPLTLSQTNIAPRRGDAGP
jgi:hypothetical protein